MRLKSFRKRETMMLMIPVPTVSPSPHRRRLLVGEPDQSRGLTHHAGGLVGTPPKKGTRERERERETGGCFAVFWAVQVTSGLEELLNRLSPWAMTYITLRVPWAMSVRTMLGPIRWSLGPMCAEFWEHRSVSYWLE